MGLDGLGEITGNLGYIMAMLPDILLGAFTGKTQSLRLKDKDEGNINGRVKLNVYLGASIESFIDTPFGEVLVEIDDPKTKTVYPEGSEVSIDFAPDRVRLLASSEE